MFILQHGYNYQNDVQHSIHVALSKLYFDNIVVIFMVNFK